MASLTISIPDADLDDEQAGSVRLTATGLAAAVPAVSKTVVVSGHATLNDGTELETTNAEIRVTKPAKPAQAVADYTLEIVSGDASVLEGLAESTTTPGLFTFSAEAGS